MVGRDDPVLQDPEACAVVARRDPDATCELCLTEIDVDRRADEVVRKTVGSGLAVDRQRAADEASGLLQPLPGAFDLEVLGDDLDPGERRLVCMSGGADGECW